MPQGRRSVPAGPEDRVPQPGAAGAGRSTPHLEVELPGGGGTLPVETADEKRMWEETSKRYIRDYRLNKLNDQILLGAILSQILTMYRAQRNLIDPKKAAEAQATISKCAEDIRKGEKALGIDKATREKGGQQTIPDYITRLKRAAFTKGVHISARVKEYERVMMEARWKIRLLRNGDVEDRDYHRLTPESLIDWLEKELAKLEEADKEWAKEQGAIWVGKL